MYTPPEDMAKTAKSYPIMIACGSTKNNIEYYCIKVENETIPVISQYNNVIDTYIS